MRLVGLVAVPTNQVPEASHPPGGVGSQIPENEYVLEATYAMQFTPAVKFQPDVQMVWNSTFNPDGSAVVFQLQLDLAW